MPVPSALPPQNSTAGSGKSSANVLTSIEHPVGAVSRPRQWKESANNFSLVKSGTSVKIIQEALNGVENANILFVSTEQLETPLTSSYVSNEHLETPLISSYATV